MKSYNHVFELIIDEDNIRMAIEKASLGKRNRSDVIKTRKDPEKYVKILRHHLIQKTYRIPKHSPVKINDGINNKVRYIIKPNFMYEQIVHHAIVQAMQPIFLKGMYEYVCGSVPGRGAIHGKKYIERFIKNNAADIKYVLKMDIHHFFQCINHDILKSKLQRIIHDEDALWLLYLLIDEYSDHEKDGVEYGLPLGYYTSQWLSNWYLQDLDHFIKEKLHAKCYVRYMDDMVIFGRNKKEMHRILDEIQKFLNEKLDLELKRNYQIFRFDYISFKDGKRKGRALDFMGFKFYRDKTILRKSIMLKATRKAKKIHKKNKSTWYDAAQMLSYMGWFTNSDTYDCYLQYMKGVIDVRQLRQSISKEERRKNNAKRNLQKVEKY